MLNPQKALVKVYEALKLIQGELSELRKEVKELKELKEKKGNK